MLGCGVPIHRFKLKGALKSKWLSSGMLERDGSVEHEVNEYNYRNFKLPMLLILLTKRKNHYLNLQSRYSYASNLSKKFKLDQKKFHTM